MALYRTGIRAVAESTGGSGYGTRGGTAATLSAETTFPAWRLSLSNRERLFHLQIRLKPLVGVFQTGTPAE